MGDTAGTLDNIVSCKLYRPGSVGFVSKSGGMSNEMYNVLSRTTDGLYEGAEIDSRQVLQCITKAHMRRRMRAFAACCCTAHNATADEQ